MCDEEEKREVVDNDKDPVDQPDNEEGFVYNNQDNSYANQNDSYQQDRSFSYH